MERNFNAVLALIISAVLLGGFAVQVFMNETPCSLCFLQRVCMMSVAIGALMNCRFGPHKAFYGLSLLASVLGGTIALRQIALHICPEFPLFGKPVFGLSLYTWSFLVFASSVAYIALMLIFFDQSREREDSMNIFGHLIFILLFAIGVGNIASSFMVCGWGPCG